VELFTAEVIQYCKEDYMPIKKTLEREVKNCKKLIIWTDCDREGIWEGFIFNGDVNEIKTSHVLKKVKESGWKS
jgi:DNA topoisomerase IA